MTWLSGLIVAEQCAGDTFIPASQRPDGTWRKARRVKGGYVPQEEVPLYESKGKQFMSRNTKTLEPVKLASGETAQRPIPGLFIIQPSNCGGDKVVAKKSKKSSPTNNNQQQHRKKVDDLAKQLEKIELVLPVTDPTKKLKNLKKRLREVELLEEKLKGGSIVKPEPEQLLKIQRKTDLLIQIDELEKQIG